tara:strand:- start:40 stop:348 length:309 start_codon:yes stop_codon:yes gene_type:complete
MTIDINRKSEGVDYDLIPDYSDEQAWNIRIKTGDFIETVIKFGNISADGKEGQLHFNFTVVESPIESLTPDDVNLQNECGSILHSVIEGAIAKKEIELTERK